MSNQTTMTLDSLVAWACYTSKSKGFHEPLNPKFGEVGMKLALIHSEVSEALEALRETDAGDSLATMHFEPSGKPVGFASEIADVVIRIGDLCGYLGIDLTEAVAVKMAYNATRPPKHGKQF